LPRLEAEAVPRLEQWIDEATGQVAPLRHFVLPAGSELAARLHVARTVCRRGERAVARLALDGGTEAEMLAYLNRLGDLLFAWARLANHAAGVADVLWVPKT
jgi:cob(I)alamin adenosyltransferase